MKRNIKRFQILIVISLVIVIVFTLSYCLYRLDVTKEQLEVTKTNLKIETDKNEILKTQNIHLQEEVSIYSQKNYTSIDFQVIKTSKISKDFYHSFCVVENLSEEIETKFRECGTLRGGGMIGEDDTFYYFYIGLGKKTTQDYGIDMKSITYNKNLNILQFSAVETNEERYIGNRDIETYHSILVRIKKAGIPKIEKNINYSIVFQD